MKYVTQFLATAAANALTKKNAINRGSLYAIIDSNRRQSQSVRHSVGGLVSMLLQFVINTFTVFNCEFA